MTKEQLENYIRLLEQENVYYRETNLQLLEENKELEGELSDVKEKLSDLEGEVVQVSLEEFSEFRKYKNDYNFKRDEYPLFDKLLGEENNNEED